MDRIEFEKLSIEVGYDDFRKLSNGSYVDKHLDRAWLIYQKQAQTQLPSKTQQNLTKVFFDCTTTISQITKELERDAALGNVAMHYVDRTGDVHPGIDDAETICSDFHKAMIEELEKWLPSKMAVNDKK